MGAKAWVTTLMIMSSGCGHDPGSRGVSQVLHETPPKAPIEVAQTKASPLRSDDDVTVLRVKGWIDLMPGIRFLGGPHTRAQVTFTALSRGCTTVDDFAGKVTVVGRAQVLTIRRIRPDTCSYDPKLLEWTLSVYGEYQPALPLLVNNQPVPTEEHIIY